jgi:hypothetical protein
VRTVVSHAFVDGTLVLNSHFLGSDCTDADSLHASDCTVRMTVKDPDSTFPCCSTSEAPKIFHFSFRKEGWLNSVSVGLELLTN